MALGRMETNANMTLMFEYDLMAKNHGRGKRKRFCRQNANIARLRLADHLEESRTIYSVRSIKCITTVFPIKCMKINLRIGQSDFK
jgi:hypothetical protein